MHWHNNDTTLKTCSGQKSYSLGGHFSILTTQGLQIIYIILYNMQYPSNAMCHLDNVLDDFEEQFIMGA